MGLFVILRNSSIIFKAQSPDSVVSMIMSPSVPKDKQMVLLSTSTILSVNQEPLYVAKHF